LVPNLLRCPTAGCDPSALRAASPVHFVDANDPPALLVHGERDTHASPDQSKQMAARLSTAGVPVELLLLPDVAHGFAGSTEAITRRAIHAALTATDEFFSRTLSDAPTATAGKP
jgi:dipeptidyl aminopeptidase/acylaminoacyl peptidase